MKSQLWLKLEQLIRAKPELQISEMMSGSSVPTSQRAWNTGDVDTDDLSLYIRQKLPAATRLEVQAEKLVEMELVPGFRGGAFAATGVDGYPSMTCPPETQDRLSVCLSQRSFSA